MTTQDEQRKLIEQAVTMRRKALTPAQEARRTLVDERNHAIQTLGVKAVDGVTFAKSSKGKA